MTTRKKTSHAQAANKRQKSSDAENVAPVSTVVDGKGKGKATGTAESVVGAAGNGGSTFHDQTVGDYLKGRCEAMCQEIQDHADGLIVRLKGEYERQAAELRRDANVSSETAAATRYELTLTASSGPHEGKEWKFEPINGQQIPIGRSKAKKYREQGVSLSKDTGVSTSHGKVEMREGKLMFTDLDSSNGTTYNDAELESHAPIELTDGGVLILGDSEFAVGITKL